jgi:hypothetical protein
MPPVRVILIEAADPRAELWLGDVRMAVAVHYDGRLHLRIEPRPDGEPWLVEAAGLALALDEAARRIAGY